MTFGPIEPTNTDKMKTEDQFRTVRSAQELSCCEPSRRYVTKVHEENHQPHVKTNLREPNASLSEYGGTSGRNYQATSAEGIYLF